MIQASGYQKLAEVPFHEAEGRRKFITFAESPRETTYTHRTKLTIILPIKYLVSYSYPMLLSVFVFVPVTRRDITFEVALMSTYYDLLTDLELLESHFIGKISWRFEMRVVFQLTNCGFQ